ncbi:MAG: hypothetical protein ACKOSQ_12435 [Planctomycetaceae bacterium]
MNLTTMSDAARQSLADHLKETPTPRLYVICTPRLTGDMLPLVKAIAARQGEVVLGNVTTLDADDAAEVARLLAAVEGGVGLPRLKRVSAAALETLREAPNVVLPPTEMLTVVAEAAGAAARQSP